MTPLLFQFHQCHLFCVADLFSWKIFVTSCFSPRADPSTYKFHDVFFTRGSRQVFPARYIVGPKYQDHRNDYHFIHIILFLKGTGIEKGKSNFQSGQPDAQKPHFSSLKKWFFGHMLFLYIYICFIYRRFCCKHFQVVANDMGAISGENETVTLLLALIFSRSIEFSFHGLTYGWSQLDIDQKEHIIPFSRTDCWL